MIVENSYKFDRDYNGEEIYINENINLNELEIVTINIAEYIDLATYSKIYIDSSLHNSDLFNIYVEFIYNFISYSQAINNLYIFKKIDNKLKLFLVDKLPTNISQYWKNYQHIYKKDYKLNNRYKVEPLRFDFNITTGNITTGTKTTKYSISEKKTNNADDDISNCIIYKTKDDKYILQINEDNNLKLIEEQINIEKPNIYISLINLISTTAEKNEFYYAFYYEIYNDYIYKHDISEISTYGSVNTRFSIVDILTNLYIKYLEYKNGNILTSNYIKIRDANKTKIKDNIKNLPFLKYCKKQNVNIYNELVSSSPVAYKLDIFDKYLDDIYIYQLDSYQQKDIIFTYIYNYITAILYTYNGEYMLMYIEIIRNDRYYNEYKNIIFLEIIKEIFSSINNYSNIISELYNDKNEDEDEQLFNKIYNKVIITLYSYYYITRDIFYYYNNKNKYDFDINKFAKNIINNYNDNISDDKYKLDIKQETNITQYLYIFYFMYFKEKILFNKKKNYEINMKQENKYKDIINTVNFDIIYKLYKKDKKDKKDMKAIIDIIDKINKIDKPTEKIVYINNILNNDDILNIDNIYDINTINYKIYYYILLYRIISEKKLLSDKKLLSEKKLLSHQELLSDKKIYTLADIDTNNHLSPEYISLKKKFGLNTITNEEYLKYIELDLNWNQYNSHSQNKNNILPIDFFDKYINNISLFNNNDNILKIAKYMNIYVNSINTSEYNIKILSDLLTAFFTNINNLFNSNKNIITVEDNLFNKLKYFVKLFIVCYSYYYYCIYIYKYILENENFHINLLYNFMIDDIKKLITASTIISQIYKDLLIRQLYNTSNISLNIILVLFYYNLINERVICENILYNTNIFHYNNYNYEFLIGYRTYCSNRNFTSNINSVVQQKQANNIKMLYQQLEYIMGFLQGSKTGGQKIFNSTHKKVNILNNKNKTIIERIIYIDKNKNKFIKFNKNYEPLSTFKYNRKNKYFYM